MNPDYMENTAHNDDYNSEDSTWNDSYKIFIPAIDDQHRTFFNIYDDLRRSSEEGANNEMTQIFISRLCSYIKEHFCEEELLMKAANFDGYEEHLRQHKFFEKKMEELQIAYTYKNPLLRSQLMLFIRKWFLSHISNADFKFKDKVVEYLGKK